MPLLGIEFWFLLSVSMERKETRCVYHAAFWDLFLEFIRIRCFFRFKLLGMMLLRYNYFTKSGLHTSRKNLSYHEQPLAAFDVQVQCLGPYCITYLLGSLEKLICSLTCWKNSKVKDSFQTEYKGLFFFEFSTYCKTSSLCVEMSNMYCKTKVLNFYSFEASDT